MGSHQRAQAMHDLAATMAQAEQLLDMANTLLANAAVEANRLSSVDAGATVAHHTRQWVGDAAKRAAHAKQTTQTARMYVNTDKALT